MPAKPPLEADLEWRGDLRFETRSRDKTAPIDADGKQAPSPVETLAFALASCMASDVVHILGKQRQGLESLRAHFVGWRAEQEPRRFLKIELRFVLRGELEADKVERAIALSRETYCSVWHSMRQDIAFEVGFTIEPGSA